MRIFLGVFMNIPSSFIFQITFCGSLEKASAILCKSDSFNSTMSPKMLPNETKIISSSPSFLMNSSSSFGRGLAGLGRSGPTTRVSIMKQHRVLSPWDRTWDCNVVGNNWTPRNQGPVKITSSAQRAGEHRDGVENAWIQFSRTSVTQPVSINGKNWLRSIKWAPFRRSQSQRRVQRRKVELSPLYLVLCLRVSFFAFMFRALYSDFAALLAENSERHS